LPDAKTATAVARAIVRGQVGDQRYRQLEASNTLKVLLNGDVWSFYYYPRTIAKPVTVNGMVMVTVVTGGGAPELELSRTDAHVISFHYSR